MLRIQCPDHPNYAAIRKPRCRCKLCAFLWKLAEMGRKFNRKQLKGNK